ncbi:hypothetical protein ACJMK2_035847 [Sinanodonta woodiana]|uniref:Ig-like domain-containing protein n=1 Tax=Sinanodonta woodiana TaxID=1069815 RepID=A0ABD3WIS7_SINWO
MRFGGELLPRKNTFSCIAVYLFLSILPRSKGNSLETVCEFQDANLLFPNTPAGSAGDIRAKTWNKENGNRVASWMENTNFEPNSQYRDRLMAIGENSIKIRNATRSDSGTYMLVVTNRSSQKFTEFTLDLEVLVPPTNRCIPIITHERNALRPKLPPDICGIPMVTSKWKHYSDDISVLNFESGLEPGTYTACANGKSLRCFKEDVDKLCLNYTNTVSQVPEIQRLPQNQSSSVPVVIIAAIIFHAVLIMTVTIVLVCLKKEYIRSKLCKSMREETMENDPHEEMALMQVKTSVKGVQAFKRHLITQYRTMTALPLSPCYEENFVDVSKVYCDLDIISLGENVEGMEYIRPAVASYKEILGGDDNTDNVCPIPVYQYTTQKVASYKEILGGDHKNVGTADNDCPIPAMILGDCGSGKSSWCKNLVNKWCHYHDNNEMNLKDNDLGVPELAKFDILLYVTSQNKGEGVSFQEHVKNTLFVNTSDCFEDIISNRQPMASILLLIDGFDKGTWDFEQSLNLVFKGNKQCSIVITSRSSDLDYLHFKPLRIFQIQGMSPSTSKEYAKKVLDIISERRAEKLNVDLFWKFAEHVQVLSMCHVPLLCLSLIMFWIESKALSVDLTDVLLTLIEYYLRRAMTREKYKMNISKVLEHFDISKFFVKTKHKPYLRDHGYLLKVISKVAEKLWYSQMLVKTDKHSAEHEPNTKDNDINIELCVETGILKKSFREQSVDITFSHPLLYDLFVASSIALERRDSCTKYLTSTKAVVKNSYVIHMLCQLAPNTGQEVIKGISELKLCDENNEKSTDTKRMLTDQQIVCKIKCKDPTLQGGAPVKWLQELMYTEELSSAILSILTEGLKFTKELTVFILQYFENKNECIFRLPILPKLQGLQIEIENCTLLLHEEQEWSKENFSELHKFVLKSVMIDVKTTGYIVEALSSIQNLTTLELCPKADVDEKILALDDQKAFFSWGCLAKGIKYMTKLSTVRLHNLIIGKHLSTLIDSLCRCPMLEILDLLNLKESDTEEIQIGNSSNRRFCECTHHKVQQLEQLKSYKKSCNISKTVLLTKNTMSKESWKTLSNQLQTVSPSILHIDQVHQSGLVIWMLFQSIGTCVNLTVLSICCISAGNDLLELSSLEALHKLRKLTLCKISLPDSFWQVLYEGIGKLTKLEEISLSHLEMKTRFIKVQQLSKLILLEMREIELEANLWSTFANEIISLPKLKKMQLISCKMSRNAFSHFYKTIKHSSFIISHKQAKHTGKGEKLSLDMDVMSDKVNTAEKPFPKQ